VSRDGDAVRRMIDVLPATAVPAAAMKSLRVCLPL